YGMTETGSGVVYDGIPLEGVEVRVEAGEIRLRAPMLLRCYRDDTDPKDAAGWFHTGDAGAVGADGILSVHGRIEEVVVSGGEKIWPGAVERVLATHPAVAEVAVAGRPDPEWGERVVAYVVLRQGEVAASWRDEPARRALLAEMRELVASELAPYAAPGELVLVASLPRTALGKVRRGELASLSGPSARALPAHRASGTGGRAGGGR
ncbi:MAG: class I adenylate-forming enzyme family protein, partial [Acidimicrobiales bacterium]